MGAEDDERPCLGVGRGPDGEPVLKESGAGRQFMPRPTGQPAASEDSLAFLKAGEGGVAVGTGVHAGHAEGVGELLRRMRDNRRARGLLQAREVGRQRSQGRYCGLQALGLARVMRVVVPEVERGDGEGRGEATLGGRADGGRWAWATDVEQERRCCSQGKPPAKSALVRVFVLRWCMVCLRVLAQAPGLYEEIARL